MQKYPSAFYSATQLKFKYVNKAQCAKCWIASAHYALGFVYNVFLIKNDWNNSNICFEKRHNARQLIQLLFVINYCLCTNIVCLNNMQLCLFPTNGTHITSDFTYWFSLVLFLHIVFHQTYFTFLDQTSLFMHFL